MENQKILHVITGLNVGGAEMMLYKLLKQMEADEFDQRVVSLGDEGTLASDIRALGVPVDAVGLNPSLPNPFRLIKLVNWIREFEPDLVQTWMYHANFLGGLAGKVFSDAPVVWNIQQSFFSSRAKRSFTYFLVKLNAYLSRLVPDAVVSCSNAGREVHRELGYRDEIFEVIPNAADLESFHPDPKAGDEVRDELGLRENDFVIGLIARFHPQKDHETFVRAAGILHSAHPHTRFVLCGRKVTPDNRELSCWIDKAGIRDAVHLLGQRDDIPRILSTLDLATLSSSFGEGSPNVLMEAMACGVPCVVTDVGDSAETVGETGLAVRPESPEELAEGWERFVSMTDDERMEWGKQARRRVEQEYSLPKITRQYRSLYRALLDQRTDNTDRSI